MGAKASLELIEELQRASREQDFDRYSDLLADDVVFRMAGVPAALGGVTTGRDAVVAQMRQNTGAGRFEVKQMFGDDDRVCVVGKVSAERFPGNAYLKAKDVPYSTYECIVYRIADGKVAESTAYVNWLDPYVQVGLVDASTLTGS
jgi:ketosteroid isomerase-like protein